MDFLRTIRVYRPPCEEHFQRTNCLKNNYGILIICILKKERVFFINAIKFYKIVLQTQLVLIKYRISDIRDKSGFQI